MRPSHFGRYEVVEWKPSDSPERSDAIRAAQWQHAVAFLASAALVYREWDRADLARLMGRERQYVWDRLQGRTHMSLTDCASLQRLLGVALIRPTGDAPIPVGLEAEPADDGVG